MKSAESKTCLLAVLVAVFLGSGFVLGGKYNAVVNIGDRVPTFAELPTTSGSQLSLNDIEDEVLVLVFLANHCPWVKGGDGDLIKLVDEMKGRSVRVVGVSVNHREDDRLPAMKEHAAQVGYNFTYVYDESQELGRKLGATITPEYFVFGSDRRLVYMGLLHNSPTMMRRDGKVEYTKGEPTEFYVKDAIEAVLAGETVPSAETRAQGCSVKYTP